MVYRAVVLFPPDTRISAIENLCSKHEDPDRKYSLSILASNLCALPAGSPQLLQQQPGNHHRKYSPSLRPPSSRINTRTRRRDQTVKTKHCISSVFFFLVLMSLFLPSSLFIRAAACSKILCFHPIPSACPEILCQIAARPDSEGKKVALSFIFPSFLRMYLLSLVHSDQIASWSLKWFQVVSKTI